jgi:predicted transcriptional regulator
MTTLVVRLEDADKLTLTQMAEATGKTVSEVVRDLIAKHTHSDTSNVLEKLARSAKGRVTPSSPVNSTNYKQYLYGNKP